MDKRLQAVFADKEDNYLLPFFWQHEGNREHLAEQIQKIYESGCRAFCVESRPYEDFCGPEWWTDMGIILAEAKRRDMKVWILDDKHFPTGFANGLIETKYPERRRWYLREHHVDLMGPMEDASVLVPQMGEDRRLLGICAYRRSGDGEALVGEPIVLPIPAGRFLYLNVPEGCWRVFFIMLTTASGATDHEFYMDMLSEESVHVLIEAVYEPHYQHFAEYFGNTIAGFFSDEPTLDSPYVGPWGQNLSYYNRTVGQPGLVLPWNDGVAHWMTKDGLADPIASIPALWYTHDIYSDKARLSYMDAVTGLWKKNFSLQVGNWCRAHGVEYIGHIIEDMNAHARLGSSGGHFFRSLDGQDMSGIDIVLHQVMPGFGDYQTAASIANGTADPEFFHYVLAQLAASQSRLNPRMQGRAMCEVFGAFGWAESVPFMKWLMDFLLVRGTTHFVPHAFTDIYPDPDCPPHFYAKGNDPQFAGFSKLMPYVNKMSHLLCGAQRQAPAAVLYHGELEWINGADCMMTQKPAKVLYDSHIDYDIVPLDALLTAEADKGIFTINGQCHSFLAIPQAEKLPEQLVSTLSRLHQAGVPLFFMNHVPAVCEGIGEAVTLEALADTVKARNLVHSYGDCPHLLRIAAFKRDTCTYYMLFNECTTDEITCEITLPEKGNYLRMDLLNGLTEKCSTDGKAGVRLAPYESTLLVFDAFGSKELEVFNTPVRWKESGILDAQWDIETLELGIEYDYTHFKQNSPLFNITGPNGLPDFSGVIRYSTKFSADTAVPMQLDLGKVGFTAQAKLNGKDMGMRICSPYRFDLTGLVQAGENTLEIVVANTLVQRSKDFFSNYMQIPPSGLLGPVTLLTPQD